MFKRFSEIRLTLCLFLLIPVPLMAGTDLESWITKCAIVTGDAPFIDVDARAVAGGVSMDRHGKWGWCSSVQNAQGVLVVCPLAPNKPAEIRFRISPLESKDKKLVIMARGSEVEPGVSLKVVGKGKIVRTAVLNRGWQKVEIPITELPVGTGEVVFEIHAIQWAYEYCYIDYIDVR